MIFNAIRLVLQPILEKSTIYLGQKHLQRQSIHAKEQDPIHTIFYL